MKRLLIALTLFTACSSPLKDRALLRADLMAKSYERRLDHIEDDAIERLEAGHLSDAALEALRVRNNSARALIHMYRQDAKAAREE